MGSTFGKFRNAIVCDDVRDEIGNKKSLMGVISGNVLVSSFPAHIQIAAYFEYMPDPNCPDTLNFLIRISQDDFEIGQLKSEAQVNDKNSPVNIILPKGIMLFEKPATLRIRVSVNDEAEEELVSKRVGINPTPST